MSNAGVEMIQNIDNLLSEMRPETKQNMENPVAGTSQLNNEGECKVAEGGQSQGVVQGPQDTSDRGDIWHLAPEVGEIKVGGG